MWQGTSGPHNARIMVVGEAWGAQEKMQGKPFIGQSGDELNRMLAEAGFDRKQVFCTNLVSDKPPANEFHHWLVPTRQARKDKVEPVNGLYITPKVREGLDTLYTQIEAVQPDIILAMGNYAFWALSSRVAISNFTPKGKSGEGYKTPTGMMLWRGSMLRTDRGPVGIPLVPMLHPAFIMRNWPWRAITVHDMKSRIKPALQGRWDKPPRRYIAPPTFHQVQEFMGNLLTRLSAGPVRVACDIETSRRCITTIGFCHDSHFAISIPFMHHSREPYWPHEQHVVVVKWIRRILLHPNLQLVGQNFLYDMQYIQRWWRVTPRLHFDTMLAQHLLFPTSPKALYYIASMTCEWYQFWKDDKKESDDSEDLEGMLRYNCDDLFYTLEASKALERAIHSMGLDHLMQERLAQNELAFEMMQRGIRIDSNVRSKMLMECTEASAERQQFLDRVMPDWVIPETSSKKPWYQSAIQTRRLFYESLGFKSIRHRQTGNATVNEEALEELKLRYPELTQVFQAILELRSLGVFANNFLSAAIDPDNKMRCSFNVAGTSTFRWSSSENAFGRGTNLQNIPAGGEM